MYHGQLGTALHPPSLLISKISSNSYQKVVLMHEPIFKVSPGPLFDIFIDEPSPYKVLHTHEAEYPEAESASFSSTILGTTKAAFENKPWRQARFFVCAVKLLGIMWKMRPILIFCEDKKPKIAFKSCFLV
jgi:hypothetical protein